MTDRELTSNYVKDGHQKRKLNNNPTSNNFYYEYDEEDQNPKKLPHITSFASLSDLTEPSTNFHNNRRNRSRGHRKDDDIEKKERLYHSSDEDVYIVKQKHGYCSIFFSLVQTLVLICMVWQCGLAPMNINPMVGPFPDALSYWGGKNTVLIVEDGEYWRLLTPILLHAGIIHLFCNVSVQLETGAFFEREWGSFTWLSVYIVSALGSSILSCDSMPNSISVGSSGAVMGLFGAKLSEVFCRACEVRRTAQDELAHEVRMEQLGGVLCSVTVVGIFSFIPYVDWAAHLGGLLAGQTIGLVLFSRKIRSRRWAFFWCIVGLVITLFSFMVSIFYMLNYVEAEPDLRDVCEYYKRYFEDYECNCQLEE